MHSSYFKLLGIDRRSNNTGSETEKSEGKAVLRFGDTSRTG